MRERERQNFKVNLHIGHLDSKINKVESRTSKWAWHYFQEKLIKIILPLLFQSQHNGINLVLSEKKEKEKSLGVRICERETSPHKSNDNGEFKQP